jgi:hypothetical protein
VVQQEEVVLLKYYLKVIRQLQVIGNFKQTHLQQMIFYFPKVVLVVLQYGIVGYDHATDALRFIQMVEKK